MSHLSMEQQSLLPLTKINPLLPPRGRLETGTVLHGRYIVVEALDTPSAEADLYRCHYDGDMYTAKVYRRQSGLDPELLRALRQQNSAHLARLFDSGLTSEYPFEIWQYYRRSLARRTFSYEDLRNRIIPQLNEGLRLLHRRQQKIIHCDLKPANIMEDEQGNIVLADFGSAVMLDTRADIAFYEQVATTPGFAAPEIAARHLLWEGTDYYALGLTLFVLFSGRMPFPEVSDAERDLFLSQQEPDYPGDMPIALRRLISALLRPETRRGHFISHKRWLYEDVRRWCRQPDREIDQRARGTAAYPDAVEPGDEPGLGSRLRHGMTTLATSVGTALARTSRRLLLALLIALVVAGAGYTYLSRLDHDPEASSYLSVMSVSPRTNLGEGSIIYADLIRNGGSFGGGRQLVSYSMEEFGGDSNGSIVLKGEEEVFFDSLLRRQRHLALFTYDFPATSDYILRLFINGTELYQIELHGR